MSKRIKEHSHGSSVYSAAFSDSGSAVAAFLSASLLLMIKNTSAPIAMPLLALESRFEL